MTAMETMLNIAKKEVRNYGIEYGVASRNNMDEKLLDNMAIRHDGAILAQARLIGEATSTNVNDLYRSLDIAYRNARNEVMR